METGRLLSSHIQATIQLSLQEGGGVNQTVSDSRLLCISLWGHIIHRNVGSSQVNLRIHFKNLKMSNGPYVKSRMRGLWVTARSEIIRNEAQCLILPLKNWQLKKKNSQVRLQFLWLLDVLRVLEHPGNKIKSPHWFTVSMTTSSHREQQLAARPSRQHPENYGRPL